MRTLQTMLVAIPIVVVMMPSQLQAQPYVDPEGSPEFFVGTSAFLIANLIPDDEPPAFGQLNFGARLTPTDTLSLEAITWQVFRPVGIQHWQSGDRFPGKVRSIGVAVAYQRYLWRGMYTALHVAHFAQRYSDEGGNHIQTGFQLFMTLRFGYHFSFFDDVFFIEPNIAFTAWPINTNMPESFQEQEDRWTAYDLLEPGLHFGFNF